MTRQQRRAADRAARKSADAAPSAQSLTSMTQVVLDALEADPVTALQCAERMMEVSPRDIRSRAAHGYALHANGRFADALVYLDLALRPDTKRAIPSMIQAVHGGRAHALFGLGRFEEMLESADRALKFGRTARVLEARAIALAALGRKDEMAQLVDEALELVDDDDPERPRLCGGFAGLLLRHGDFERGLPLSESRRPARDEGDAIRPIVWTDAPAWGGVNAIGGDLTDRTILLRHEDGLGEALLFNRYVGELLKLGAAKVTLEIPPKLAGLEWGFRDGVEYIPVGASLPLCDCETSIYSLPYLFGTSMETIPWPGPYVAAPIDRIERWRERIKPEGFTVCIAWGGGNPKNWEGIFRTVPLPEVERILAVPGVQFIGIERFMADDDRARLESKYNFRHYGGELAADFADMAAVMHLADLVIISDNSALHLAGAMGKPTMFACAYFASWRWHVGRDDSPWFPSLKLYRQPTFGNWADVVDRICGDLRERATSENWLRQR